MIYHVAVVSSLLSILAVQTEAAEFQSRWPEHVERVWLGPQYWANPLQDWRIRDGRMECISRGGNRNVHVLTRQLSDRPGDVQMTVRVGSLDAKQLKGARGSAGFRIGILGPLREYRNSLIKGRGIDAGLNMDGTLFLGPGQPEKADPVDLARGDVELRLVAEADDGSYTLTLSAHDAESGEPLGSVSRTGVPAGRLVGNLALVSNFSGPVKGGKNSRFWFAGWTIGGSKVGAHEDRAFGPILFAMHTLSRGVLKMTAQMPPVGRDESQQVLLYAKQDNGRRDQVGKSAIDPLSRTATFRVAGWDTSRDVPYRLVYEMTEADGSRKEHAYAGTVRREPVDRDEVVVAGFTGHTDYLVPNTTLAGNVAKVDPDVLVFTGDQLYEGNAGFGIVRSPVDVAALDYLRKWYIFGWSFRELMRDRLTVCLPDDHDVYQGNIWGQGGRDCNGMANHDKGGYAMHADWVNAVQRTQCSHLPDPFDPTPVEQGITVYYAPMVYGGVGFAIIEDRKFKSGPSGKVNTWPGRPDHVKDPHFDPQSVDKPGLALLGDRQLKFLREFAADWRGHQMKLACSQTIFANVANYHGRSQEFLVADLDSNGWPQTARNNALKELRRGFMFHLAGDQHLASIVHHGVDDWRDAIVSFCVPSIAAGYPRSWHPEREGKVGKNRPQGAPEYVGDFLDGLANHVTVWAVGNPVPRDQQRKDPEGLGHDKASGFGVVRVNKTSRTYRLECWKLLSDPADPKPEDQFPGWPRTVDQMENYGRQAVAYLPELQVSGMTDPVVQVKNEADGEIVYTLRIKGKTFRPKVFAKGTYTVRVGRQEPLYMKTLNGVDSVAKGDRATVRLDF